MSKKIETLKFDYKTKNKKKSFEIDVFLSAEKHFYYQNKQIPQEIHDQNGETYMAKRESHSTYRSLREELENMVKEYEEAQVVETKEKIIVYQVHLQGYVAGETEDAKGKSFSDLPRHGTGLAIHWEIFWKAKKGGKTVYYSFYTRGYDDTLKEQVGSETYIEGEQMAWTPQRQEWFEKLDKSLELLIKNVNNFFNDNPIELTAIIDSGRLLPLPNQERA